MALALQVAMNTNFLIPTPALLPSGRSYVIEDTYQRYLIPSTLLE